MRERFEKIKAERDAARGRPLTAREQLDNLRYAIARICDVCGAEAEPHAKCARCDHVNHDPVLIP